MPTQDEMTINERRKYLKLMAPRYQQAKRKKRSQLLYEDASVRKDDEFYLKSISSASHT